MLQQYFIYRQVPFTVSPFHSAVWQGPKPKLFVPGSAVVCSVPQWFVARTRLGQAVCVYQGIFKNSVNVLLCQRPAPGVGWDEITSKSRARRLLIRERSLGVRQRNF